mgnify:CR=1 FL=1
MGDQLLKVESLSKGQILDHVSFEMKDGEMLAVMGPSGSGKSTLLYQVAGMDQPSAGKVWVKDTEIAGLPEDEKAKIRLRHMGFVFQQMNMMANLNILDNIMLPAVQANKGRGRKTKAELERAARKLMQKLSISGLEERRVTQVSGGQLQRACICRSMMNSPGILERDERREEKWHLLFADEPTGALNKKAAGEVMEELVKLNREGTAILMVTHDSKVASNCDRILYLLDGRICGELVLGKLVPGTEKGREERVNKWLAGMGW